MTLWIKHGYDPVDMILSQLFISYACNYFILKYEYQVWYNYSYVSN